MHLPASSPPRIRFTYEPWWDSRLAPVAFSFEGYSDRDLIAYMLKTGKTFFDADLLEYVAMVGPRGGVYLDIGANIGNHAVFFATFCAAHVVAFEPHPELLGVLERNLRDNGVAGRTTVVPVGLSDADETGSMQIRAEHEDNIGASLIARGTEPAAPGSAVALRPLDAFTSGPASVLQSMPLLFVKIDVEGMELEVLRGAAQTLRVHRPQLLVESIAPEAARDASDYLKTFGYEAITQIGNPPSCHFIDPQRHALRPNQWFGGTYWSHMVHAAEEELRAVTPDDAVLIVADHDELGVTGAVAGRRRLAFLEREGSYSVHPATAAEAIDELERLRAAGGTFLVLTWPVFWYLDVFRDFDRYLRSRYRFVHESHRVVVFEV